MGGRQDLGVPEEVEKVREAVERQGVGVPVEALMRDGEGDGMDGRGCHVNCLEVGNLVVVPTFGVEREEALDSLKRLF